MFEIAPWWLIILLSAWPLARLGVCLAQWMVRRVRADMIEGHWSVVRLDVPTRLLPRLFAACLGGNAVWLGLVLPVITEQPLGSGQAVSALLALANGAVLGMLAWVDAETGILPNELILLAGSFVFLIHWQVSGEVLPRTPFLWGMTLGYAVPILFNGVYLVFTGKDALGQGDAKLLAVIGLWLGALTLVDVWLIACALLLVYTAIKRCRDTGTLSLKSSVPFGPFLVAAANMIFICGSV